ncbi:uncharacterized protein LOC124276214 [Haliotis rubra]|uniref:uncharacterized protein LOC124276214 n=1 Tax=Haliotis rubra TaxID=36100 RepID=UPI001EE59F6D|nr:uncharacterized protein LOC124276214 [Haliotis rubra]
MTQQSAEPATRVAANVGKATFRLPPFRDGIASKGFGTKMVSRTSAQSLIYRSVPPRPLSYTFTDILETYPTQGKSRSKTAPVSTNAPEEYAQRFKSRPTTRPKVVEFDGNAFQLSLKKRGVTGFLPSVKLRVIPPSQPRAKNVELPDLQLEPAMSSRTRQKSTSGRLSSRSNRSSRTRKSSTRTRDKSASERETEWGIKVDVKSPEPWVRFPESGVRFPEPGIRFPEKFSMSNSSNHDQIGLPDFMETPIVYSNVMSERADYNDLTSLPPPKKILPKKDAPWVYRFKVKRNMNALSRIMASKPNQIVAQSGQGT